MHDVDVSQKGVLVEVPGILGAAGPVFEEHPC